MKLGSLFSGIGGLDLGLERAGMEVVWQVENDPFCNKVLERHWPTVRRFGDIRTLNVDQLEPVDIIAGGFPCQPVSNAGQRLAHKDDRWLWPEFERVLRLARPRYVLLENVTGLFTAGFDDVLAGLSALGFDAEWSTVSACSMGAPHMRRRLFVVAYADGLGCDGRTGIEWSRRWAESQDSSQGSRDSWTAEPTVFGSPYGVPQRVDRLKGLGNAVVPEVAEYIGRRVMEAEAA